MSIVDARCAELPPQVDADVCVIGAGAAGITLAIELARNGVDVCLVESGGFTPDEATQSLYDLESTGDAVRSNYMSRARYFGGSCNLWAGRSMTLNPIDFEPRPWVPDSGWPIPHAEVARHYPQAFQALELPAPERLRAEVLAGRMSLDERSLFEGGEFTPTLSLWAKSAMRFGSAFGPALRKSRRIRVLLNLSVTSIDLNAAGSAVESVSAATLPGARTRIRARRVVLACGGIENARLLLVSRDRHPNGIGNDTDRVGRYFMDHPRAVFGRVHLRPGATIPLLRGRPLVDGKFQLGIGLSAATQERERLLNHYVTFELQTSEYAEARYQSLVQTMKVVLRRGYAGNRWDFARSNVTRIPEMIYLLSPKELMPHFVYRAYVAARDILPRRSGPQTYVAVYFCEQPPDPDSRVTLAGETDQLGLPRTRLHWKIGSEVTASVRRMQELLGQALERTGAGRLEPAVDEPAYTDASHHMGTTRMSASPRDGVVDADCRVHGIANLYLAGSSVFPCAGHANPTLTIVALALRLAGHLREQRV
ncbi:MAG: GMC family oxidoreductase [Gammaproteobacteria bacterium]|nr:MAG: GMC family oxidoreductase [Gammaproteobacteria bacterium]